LGGDGKRWKLEHKRAKPPGLKTKCRGKAGRKGFGGGKKKRGTYQGRTNQSQKKETVSTKSVRPGEVKESIEKRQGEEAQRSQLLAQTKTDRDEFRNERSWGGSKYLSKKKKKEGGGEKGGGTRSDEKRLIKPKHQGAKKPRGIRSRGKTGKEKK